jgi:hypothetical protein
MTATACALAALLTFEAAATAPAAKDECELADHRCKALLFERRAANAANAEHRAVYLFSAHRLYMRLFDQSGDARDLCAARRTIDASLAVDGQSSSLRAKSETLRADLLARVKQHDARCGSVSKRGRVMPADPPLVARGAQSPAAPTPDAPAPPLLAGPAPEPSEAPPVPDSVTSEPPASSSGALQLFTDASTRPASRSAPGSSSLLRPAGYLGRRIVRDPAAVFRHRRHGRRRLRHGGPGHDGGRPVPRLQRDADPGPHAGPRGRRDHRPRRRARQVSAADGWPAPPRGPRSCRCPGALRSTLVSDHCLGGPMNPRIRRNFSLPLALLLSGARRRGPTS